MEALLDLDQPTTPPQSAYERQKAKILDRQAAKTREGRSIGSIPAVADPARKAACGESFAEFCRVYFPRVFTLPFCADHRKVIDAIERCVREGGLFALAMPRGAGKTSLTERAALWAVLFGLRRFVFLIGSDAAAAGRILDSIKSEAMNNPLLIEDFPESLYPIERLEGISHRCKGQLFNGRPTHIGWSADAVVFPTIPDSPASGAVIRVAGLGSGFRGQKFQRPDGTSARPDLVVLDDPQSRESSMSPSQCVGREAIINGDILGLAGPGKKIAAIMPCTVIREGDLADRFLDREIHPAWGGERTRMVYAFPAATALWEQYAEIRAEELRAKRGIEKATEFYRDHREEMDAGATVAWPERYNDDELSGIQHAQNIRLTIGEAAFAAEYQNAPLPLDQPLEDDLTPAQIMARINRHTRGTLPQFVSRVTAFIDVQGTLLYWLVAGWGDDFTGSVIAYGAFPDQRKPYFSLRDAAPTLAQAVGIESLEGRLFKGLETLTNDLLTREWPRDAGSGLRIERCLVDSKWGESTAVVKQFCRQSAHAAVLLPSIGKYYGASSRPLTDRTKKPGERMGILPWLIPLPRPGEGRFVLYDSNFWKSFVHSRLRQPMGERGALTLFGDSPERHRMLADHLTAEYRVRTQAGGRTVDEWHAYPERRENHWLDCLAGAAVAASIQGSAPPNMEGRKPPTKGSGMSYRQQYDAAHPRQAATQGRPAR